MSIYGEYEETLNKVMNSVVSKIEDFNDMHIQSTGEPIYEHLNYRIKSDESMREKLVRKGLDVNTENALVGVQDAIGMRIVTTFVDDVFKVVDLLKSLDFVEVVKEKDYIHKAKPNGYRSYHMILKVTTEDQDVYGNTPGSYFVEVQLRTIAMDSWAALEHQMSYKKDIKNKEMISVELKRVADELASCDLSMQTIRNLINK